MSIRINYDKRIRLEGQETILKFRDATGQEYSYKTVIDEELGSGSSCVCYAVTVCKDEKSIEQKRILKQFYPNPAEEELDIELQGMNMCIKDFEHNENAKEMARLFEEAYEKQVELSNHKELSGIIVRPDLSFFDGATKYILYEADDGKSLEKCKLETIGEIIHFFYEFAISLEKLNEQKIVHMDIKPENILWANGKNVKFFDFDAAIDMERLDEVHYVRGDGMNPGLLAPELKNLWEFEQNKWEYLTPRLDIYSYGAMLFSFLLKRYPENDECYSRSYEKELDHIFNAKYRGALTDKEQQLLKHIIWKCIQADLGLQGRYQKTADLKKDIEVLNQSVNAISLERRKEFFRVNNRLQAAYVMDQYPLSNYRRKKDDETWVIDALIMGDEPICSEFFKNIISCSQMLDTKLVIRLASEGAQKRMAQYVNEWPLLLKTTNVFLNEKQILYYSDGSRILLDRSITSEPFANIYFYEWDKSEKAADFLSRIDGSDISWMIVATDSVDQNVSYAAELAEMMRESGKSIMIGYMDERGDGYDLRRIETDYPGLCIAPFNCSNKYSLEEKNFEKGIRGQALLLHKHYMREWNERASASEIWKDFSSSTYNITSSLCSVLSIPYKLGSIGIQSKGNVAAAEYFYRVFNEAESGRILLNKLIYLEHKRWMCFMLTEGYDKPDLKKLAKYAFEGNNDQRNKSEKLHPMLCDISPQKGICLNELSHSDWESSTIAQKKELDELDRMSLWMHQFCSRRVKEMNLEEGELKELFESLEREMHLEQFSNKDFEIFQALKITCQRMLDNESNINIVWGKICAEFEKVMAEHQKKEPFQAGHIVDGFKKLKNVMRIVVERNKYHDYKSSDCTVLEAIPLLLTHDDPIRRIYKPVSSKNWQNVISSLILEPEELVLFVKDMNGIDDFSLQRFLREERGINVTVSVRQWEELYKIKVQKRSRKSVVDITGIDGEDAFEIFGMLNLSSLPMISYKNGRLRDLRGLSEVDYYGVLKKHLTVSETFQLFHSNTYSEKEKNPMLGLSQNYQNLWNAYVRMGARRWKSVAAVFSHAEKKNYWKIEKKKLLHSEEKVYQRIPRGMLTDAKMDKIFRDLQKEKLIEQYQLPANGQTGTVTVVTKYQDIGEYLDKMMVLAKKHPYMHQFVLLKTYREPLSGRAHNEEMMYIRDCTLVVDLNIKEGTVFDDVEAKEKHLSEALEVLATEVNKKGDFQIIEQLEDNPLIQKINGTTEFVLRFVYKNDSTKACLLKEGNVLEVYTYHSIWQNALMDDIKLNVSFVWDADHSDEALAENAITNEIDLVCTKNMQTYFISCKQSMPKKEYLQEIKFFADYFGIDGKAIIVSSNWRTGENHLTELIAGRSEKMGVYYIDRDMLGNNLVQYIKNIVSGRNDWRDVHG